MSIARSGLRATLPTIGLALGLLLGLAAGLDSPFASAEDEFSAEPTVAAPAILAKSYDVRVARRGKELRVYLFDDSKQAQPPVGKVLLLKKGNEPVLGLRVLKLYPEKNQFAAKRIRRYGEHKFLDVGDLYLAYEKTGDVVASPPTATDLKDVAELEALPAPPADEEPPPPPDEATADALDSGDEKPPVPADQAGRVALEDLGSIIVDEPVEYEPFNHSIGLGLGFILNGRVSATDIVPDYFFGAGLQYGYTFKKLVFFQTRDVQDSLSGEVGVFFYRIIGSSAGVNDSYSVLPTSLKLRYSINLSPAFAIFGTAGVLKNWVVTSSGATVDTLTALGSFWIVGGAGATFRFGPNWDLRLDLGFDYFGLGMGLRF